MQRKTHFFFLIVTALFLATGDGLLKAQEVSQDQIYQPGQLKPVDSELKVAVGDMAPDFTLPSLSGAPVTLSDFRGKKNVMLSFVPAAWTPVCSGQWPGYNLAQAYFEESNTQLLGITVDNIPTLHAWTQEMGGVWFPVLSDFWPHGEVARQYGILRPEGVTERAIFLIDTAGVIRYIDVHDINERPDLETIVRQMEKLGK